MAPSAIPPDAIPPPPGSLASRLQARFDGYAVDEPAATAPAPTSALSGPANPRKAQLQIDELNHQLAVLRDQLDAAFDEFDQRLEAIETRASVAEARASVAEARASVAETHAHDAEALATQAHARIDETLGLIDGLMPQHEDEDEGLGAAPTNLRSALDRLRDRLDVG